MPLVRKWAKGKELSVYFSYKPIVWSTSRGDMVTVILQKGIAWLYCYSQATGFFTIQNQNPRFRFEEPLFLGGNDCLIVDVDELGQWIGHNRNYLEHVHGSAFTPQLLELFEEGWMDGDVEFNQDLQLWVSSFTRRRSSKEGSIKHNLRIISNQRQVLAFDSYRQEELKETRDKTWSHYTPLADRGNILEKYFERVKSYEIIDGIFVPSYK
jgi:hypothetical protein